MKAFLDKIVEELKLNVVVDVLFEFEMFKLLYLYYLSLRCLNLNM